MAFALTDVRSDLDSLLATAVDSSTWTNALKDEAARQALKEIDEQVIYETSFTVVMAGAEQDLAAISDLKEIKALAWPWADGADFTHIAVRWRYVSDQTVYIDAGAGSPQADDLLRVRHTRLHTLDGLDSVDATSVPDRHRPLLALLAALWACTLRAAEISENPALPDGAARGLAEVALRYRDEAEHRLRQVQTPHRVRWPEMGL